MTAGPLRRGRVGAAACTVVLLVSGCGSGARAPKPPDPDASAPDAPGPDAPFLDDAGEPDVGDVGLDGAPEGVPAAPPGSRPNIVYIMADDLGYGDLPAYGATDMKTPHIDRLGQEGVRFTQFYGDTWCAPSRVSLMSGRYPQRAGNTLAPNRSVLGPSLKAAGYKTAVIGKWHLGTQTSPPAQHGFDHFFGFTGCCNRYFASELVDNGTPVDRPGYLTDILTEEAVRFIGQQDAGAPFFLHVAYTAPHTPYQGPNGEMAATREVLVSMVERMDQGVGAILAALEQAGLASNTVVVFTGDNGGTNLGRNTPLSGVKWNVLEGGIRVAAYARWPGVIPGGKVRTEPTGNLDFAASVLRIAGVDSRNLQPPLDGRDVFGFVAEERPIPSQPMFWSYQNEKAVRSGDLKLVERAGMRLLFDVETDPGEQTNLIAERPVEAAQLGTLLEQWETDVATNR